MIKKNKREREREISSTLQSATETMTPVPDDTESHEAYERMAKLLDTVLASAKDLHLKDIDCNSRWNSLLARTPQLHARPYLVLRTC